MTHQCSRLCPLPEYVPVRCAGSGAFNTTSSFRIKKKSLLVQILQQDFGSFVVADAAEL